MVIAFRMRIYNTIFLRPRSNSVVLFTFLSVLSPDILTSTGNNTAIRDSVDRMEIDVPKEERDDNGAVVVGVEEGEDVLRADGRRAKELRRIRVRLGVFGQADGSAYIEHGNTKVLAAVYGPHQPRGAAARATGSKSSTKGIVNCQYSMAVFSYSAGERKRRPRGDRKTQEYSVQLRRAMESIIHLELYPKSQIDVFVEVLQVDGSVFCAAVNASTLALIDAGIPIKDYAVGCTVTMIDSPSSDDEQAAALRQGVLDANFEEECCPGVTLSIVALPKSDDSSRILLAQGSGLRLHLSRLEALRARALHGCREIRRILDAAVKRHLTLHSLPSLIGSRA